MDFRDVVKTISVGTKENKNLDKFNIDEVISKLLDPKTPKSLIGAFLVNWRTRLSTPNETKQSVEALKKLQKKLPTIQNSIEIGYSYEGYTNTQYLFLLLDQLNLDINEFNLFITLDESIGKKTSYTIKDLKYKFLIKNYITHHNRRNIFPKLSKLSKLRKELGLITVLNTIEKLLNPISSKFAITGINHKSFLDLYVYCFKNCYERLVIVCGCNNSPEINSDCEIVIIDKDKIITEKIILNDYQIEYTAKDLKTKKQFIKSHKKNIDKNLLKLNYALLLVASKKVNSITDGLSYIKSKSLIF